MNRIFRTLALAGLAATVSLTGCNKDEAAPTDPKAPAAKKADDKAGAATKQEAPMKAAVAPATPDAAMNALMDGITKKNPSAIWDFLPATYQADVTGLVHDFGAKVDAELYDKGFAVLAKAVTVLKTKKEFLLKNPMMAQALNNPMLPPGTVEKNWDGVVTALSTVTGSELAKAANLKTLDVGKFLAGTGSKLMTQGFDLAKASGQDPAAGLAGFKAELVKTEGDKATVKLTPPGGGTAKDEEFVKVEGKWIPAEMADDWKKTMDEAKKEMAGLPAQMAEAKKMALPMLTQVDGALDKLAAAKDQAEFDAAVAGAACAMMGGGGGAADAPEPAAVK